MSKPFAAQMFLARLKPLLAAGKLAFQPRNRRKTHEFMLNEALSEEDAYEIIGNLAPEHYQWGPDSDENGSAGNVMLFFYPYKKRTLYIKLKIWTDADGDAAVVLSFHEEGTHD